MKIITCAGYYRTGSSAVTDLLSEFSTCRSVGDYEFRFIHDSDGIRDLEYNIIENNNRHNTSNAIKRYIKLAKILNGGVIRKGYKRYMGTDFERLTKEYIESITELKAKAWCHFDQQSRGARFYFVDNAIAKLFKKIDPKSRVSLLKLSHEQAYYSAISSEKFYEYTKKYIYECLECMNKDNYPFLIVDQLLPPSNVQSHLKYFDDIKEIIVERDPRDIFILENEIYNWGNIPYKDVEEYCRWYEITRRHRKYEQYDSNKVFLLKFEDLIYQYNKTVSSLIDFIGLDKNDHVLPRRYFDPDVSVNGTNLAAKYPKYCNSVRYIESHLREYLYPFPETYGGEIKEPNWNV